MPAVRSALVIGAGVAGPVTAAALHRAGIEATVCEAYPALSDGIGGTLALAPNGLRALALIGADEAVREAALPITRQVMTIEGRGSVSLPPITGVEPLAVIGRGALHRLLHERVAELGVPVAYGKRLVGVEDGAEGVTAAFADGSTASADVLVGADGVRSTVRTLIDPDAPGPDDTGLLGFQGYTDVPLDLEPGVMTFAFGRRAYYLYWRTADGGVTWGANLPATEYLSFTAARATPPEEWLRTLRDTYAGDHPGEALAAATPAASLDVTGAIHIMPPVPRWHARRMVLVGDAVHAPSNSTGQGAALAIESAVQLARCLRDRPDAPSAFAAYEALRRPRVERITRRGARTNRTKTPGPVGRTMMRALMPAVLRFANLDRTLGDDQRYVIDWDEPVAVG